MRPVEGVSKFNREEWQVQLTPILNLWKKLNQVGCVSIQFIIPLCFIILNFTRAANCQTGLINIQSVLLFYLLTFTGIC